MNKTATLSVAILFLFFTAASQPVSKITTVVNGELVRVTQAVRDFQKSQSLVSDIKVRDEKGIIRKEGEKKGEVEFHTYNQAFTGDAALQQDYPNLLHTSKPANRSINNSFNGIGYSNVNPADPSLAAGPNHIVQIVNGTSGSMFSIFSKTGVQLVAPMFLDNITGKGGLGDPIVLYDQLADRFLMTEFVNKNEVLTQGLTIAVSKTNDPTGAWYIYFFSTGSIFPDYPKFSIWPNAYYAKTNDFNSTNNYVGSSVYAFDRAKMLAGATSVSMQVINSGMGYREYTMIPVSLQGTTLPAANANGMFAYLQEDVWSGSSSDSIGLLEFKVDFLNPANSVFRNVASMAAASYSSSICGAARSQCINQPNSTVMLEGLDQRIMNQPVYRNFGTWEGIVFTNSVNNGTNISSVRWYELSRSSGNWGIRQQSTFSPDNVHRFMPAIAYDDKGNIALAYNVSGSATYPGIRYTGRRSCDVLNNMTYAEHSLADGSASNASSRYGDYNHMVCDPDGKTFWFTGMFNANAQWSTKIASFVFDTCVTCDPPAGLTVKETSSANATVQWVGLSGKTYYVDYKISGSSSWINAIQNSTIDSVKITGLTSSTQYDWRVGTSCDGNFRYATSLFSTTANPLCNTPASITATNITNSGATISWASTAGAVNYTVEYKSSILSAWTIANSGTTALTLNITGLSAGTKYDYRVRTNCQGSTSSYIQSQFTTTGTLCNPPATLAISALTTTSVTLNWTAVASASKYAVDYKKTSTSTWTSASTGTTSLSKGITGLTSGTSYDWRVKTVCSTSSSSMYTVAQFSTVTVCPDQLESNNTLSGAKGISIGVNVLAQIASGTDLDYYSFSNNTTQSNISISLSNLPANYDMKLFSPTGALLLTSQNTGTNTELINYNTNVIGLYKVQVYGYNKVYNNINCYTLKVQTGSVAFSPEIYSRQIRFTKDMVVYPVPANRLVTISFNEPERSFVSIFIENSLGKTVYSKRIPVVEGRNEYQMDISRLPNGVYYVKVVNAIFLKTQILIINK